MSESKPRKPVLSRKELHQAAAALGFYMAGCNDEEFEDYDLEAAESAQKKLNELLDILDARDMKRKP